MSQASVVLDHYDRAARGLLDLGELAVDDPSRVRAQGRYEALRDLVDDLRREAKISAPDNRHQQPARPPQTLIGSILGGRAKLIAEDVMGALEGQGGPQS